MALKLKNPSLPSTPQKEEVPPKEEKKLFSRGYGEVRTKLEKGSRFLMSCFNCAYYYQAVGDKEEVCQNPEVLKYDMVVTDTSIYCNRWKMSPRKQSVKSMFKKGR